MQPAAAQGATTVAKDPVASEATQAAKLHELEALSRELARTHAADPVGAQVRYKQFFENGGYLYPSVAIRLSLLTGALHVQHDQKAQALTIYDWALQNYGDLPQSEELRRARAALLEEAKLPALNPVNMTAIGAAAMSGLQGVKVSPAAATAPVEPVKADGGAQIGTLPTLQGVGPVTVGPTLKVAVASPVTVGPLAAPVKAQALTPVTVEPASAVSVGSLPALAPMALAVPMTVVPSVKTGVTSPVQMGTAQAVRVGSPPTMAPVASPVTVQAAPSATVGALEGVKAAQTAATAVAPMARVAAMPFPSIASANGVETEARLNVPALAGIAPTIAEVRNVKPQAAVGGASLGRNALLLEGAGDARELWQNGQLSLSSLVALLEQPPLSAPTPVQVGARGALMSLLVEEGQALWMPAKAKSVLTYRLRGEVADALIERQDERGIALWQQLVEEAQGQEKASRLYRLSAAHEKRGESEKAAQALERAVPLLDEAKQPQWAASTLIGAARLYNAAQNTAKMLELYARVPVYNDGWLTILSFYDQAMPLMSEGKLEQARKLLIQPLNARESVMEGEIAQNAWLASLDYRQGKLEDALRRGEAVVKAGEGQTFSEASTKNLFEMGRDIYNRAGGWKNQPIQTNTKQVVFQANPSQPDRPLYARFRIKTYGDTSITASVDNPNIQARVLPVNNWRREGQNAPEEEMEVVVQSNSLTTYTDVPLVLSSATRGRTMTVRVSLVDKSA